MVALSTPLFLPPPVGQHPRTTRPTWSGGLVGPDETDGGSRGGDGSLCRFSRRSSKANVGHLPSVSTQRAEPFFGPVAFSADVTDEVLAAFASGSLLFWKQPSVQSGYFPTSSSANAASRREPAFRTRSRGRRRSGQNPSVPEQLRSVMMFYVPGIGSRAVMDAAAARRRLHANDRSRRRLIFI